MIVFHRRERRERREGTEDRRQYAVDSRQKKVKYLKGNGV